jgi:hypothetical protein
MHDWTRTGDLRHVGLYKRHRWWSRRRSGALEWRGGARLRGVGKFWPALCHCLLKGNNTTVGPVSGEVERGEQRCGARAVPGDDGGKAIVGRLLWAWPK